MDVATLNDPCDAQPERIRYIEPMNLLSFLAVLCLQGPAGEPTTAEYAFRWNPKEGGPASVEDVQRILGGKTKSTKVFSVRYHRIPRDKNWQTSAEAIFRERSRTGEKPEFRLKFRSATPFERTDACPDGMEFSYEADVTFKASDSVRKVFSVSCSGTDPNTAATLKTTPLSCQSTFTRYDSKHYRLEVWTFPNSASILEISHRSSNTAADRDRFGLLVGRLLHAGAEPSTDSKTDLGQNCAE